MNGEFREVPSAQRYGDRPSGSPFRVKADPALVSDVSVMADEDSRNKKYHDDTLAWDTIVTDLPSDDEDGESFDKTVATFLIGMNMVQYLHLFKDADVGLNLFLTLTEDDIRVLGVQDDQHCKDMAHCIANIRKQKKGDVVVRGIQDDIADSTLSVQEAIPLICHTVKHVNNLVILLRNFRARLSSRSLRNQVMDQHYSAALGAKLLTKEALVQAELLKVQLQGMLLKIDPMKPEQSLLRKNKSSNSKSWKKGQKFMLGTALMSASLSIILVLLLGRR